MPSLLLVLRTALTALLLLSSGYALSVVNVSPVTVNSGDLVLCADGKRYTVCAPGNVPAVTSLAFSDLISGPDTGIGDGNGSGVIVTVWGFNLGSTQGASTIQFRDSLGVARNGYVYYWKDADGTLPSGPANLFESHGLQEIAFSIPDSADGLGTIEVTTSLGAGSLPFTVRSGSIYHVNTTGNDSTGDGSYGSPWLTIDRADNSSNGVGAGSTIYIHGVTTGDEDTNQVIYNNNPNANNSLAAQFSYVAYPNTRVEAIGARGFSQYGNNQEGFVSSKLSYFSAEADTDANDQPVNVRQNVSYGIFGSANGRAVGNFITDEHPSDTSGACPDAEQGAIVADSLSADAVSNFKMLGNHIKDYGCDGTTKFHHTTYFTIRSGSDNEQLVAPQMAFNYLQDNKAKNGLHYYDENNSGTNCGQFTTTYKIHDNVIINQSGSAINMGAACPVNTQFDAYNNVAVNVGLKLDHDGIGGASNGPAPNALNITAGSDFTSTLNVYNNIFKTWNDDDETGDVFSCISAKGSGSSITLNYTSNYCETSKDKPFYMENYQNPTFLINYSGNIFYTEVANPSLAILPAGADTTNLTIDPQLPATPKEMYQLLRNR